MDNWQSCYWKNYLEEKHIFQRQFPLWVQRERGKQQISSTATVPELCIFWIAFQDIKVYFLLICWCSRGHRGQKKTHCKQPNCLMMYVQFKVNTQGFIRIHLIIYLDTFWINTLETDLTKRIWFCADKNFKLNLHLCYFYSFLIFLHFRNIQLDCIRPKASEESTGFLSRLTELFSCPIGNWPILKPWSIIWATLCSLPCQHLSCNYFPSCPTLLWLKRQTTSLELVLKPVFSQSTWKSKQRISQLIEKLSERKICLWPWQCLLAEDKEPNLPVSFILLYASSKA